MIIINEIDPVSNAVDSLVVDEPLDEFSTFAISPPSVSGSISPPPNKLSSYKESVAVSEYTIPSSVPSLTSK